VLQDPRLLERVWESAADAMAVSHPDGRVIAANPAYFELYGYAPSEVIGRSFAIIFPQAARAQATEEYDRAFNAPDVAPVVETTVRRQDGSERIVASRYTFIVEDGRRTAMLSVIRDITEQKRAEARLEEMLEREQAARHDAEVALRTRDQIVAFATHDLRNPLTSIKGYAQLLQRQAARQDPSGEGQLLAGLKGIDAAAVQMDALIDEMLDLARIQAGEPLHLNREPTDLVLLVRESIAAWQKTTDTHALRADLPIPELVGNWDVARLRRVLGNLLSNAIKYSAVGGTITVAVARETTEASDWAVTTVQDEGQGIPAGDLPLLFARFSRGSNAAGMAGTGLGLAAAREILQQQGGTIALASQAGKGTTVTVRLPLD
jgi:PAS domain S-box-containing protein